MQKTKSRKFYELASPALLAIAVSAAVCAFAGIPGWLEAGVAPWRRFAAKTVILSVPLFLAALHLFLPAERIWEWIDRHRFSIAAAVLFLAIFFKVSGSSIGMWNQLIENDNAMAPLFGTSRAIRSDEWGVSTPLTLSQSFARPAWPYFNDIPRAVPTDMFSVYIQPVRHPLVAFRPFLAGHVLFGFIRGLSFFWVGRWLALLLVAYELMKLVSGGRKALAGAGAALVAFAPVVQWWGAINALAEMLMSGSLFVLCLDRFMAGRTLRERWFPTTVMAYCSVAYAMTLYPAAMVPLAYAFAALALWVVSRRARGFHADAATWTFAAFAALAAAGCLGWYLHLSQDAFRTTAATTYPGHRFECGGNGLKYLGLPWGNLFFPWTTFAIEQANSFEFAMFLDFFPLGFALAAFLFFRRRVRDRMSILLVAASLLLAAYCLVGLPRWAAGATMLSRSTTSRAFVAFGFVQLLLLIRSAALLRPAVPVKWSILAAVANGVAAVGLAHLSYPTYLGWQRLAAVGGIAAVSALLVLRHSAWPRATALFLAALALCAGGFVNPVQRGDAGVLSSDLIRKIRRIVEIEGGTWLVDGEAMPMNLFPLMAGAPTINAGNSYPVVERWKEVDPEEKSKHIWNRYCNSMRMDVKPDGDVAFRLLYLDSFQVDVPMSLLNRWKVRWVLSHRNLKGLSGDGLWLRQVAKASGWGIYVVEPAP